MHKQVRTQYFSADIQTYDLDYRLAYLHS